MSDPNDLELSELTPGEGEAPAADAAPAEAPEAAPDAAAAPADQTRAANALQETLRTGSDLEAVYDVPVQVSAVLGKATLQVSQLLKLGRGAVVELDRRVGEAIDIYINDRLVARGEVVVVEERLGVTMTEIIKSDR